VALKTLKVHDCSAAASYALQTTCITWQAPNHARGFKPRRQRDWVAVLDMIRGRRSGSVTSQQFAAFPRGDGAVRRPVGSRSAEWIDFVMMQSSYFSTLPLCIHISGDAKSWILHCIGSNLVLGIQHLHLVLCSRVLCSFGIFVFTTLDSSSKELRVWDYDANRLDWNTTACLSADRGGILS
jgi:hypothetical protein